MEDFNSKYSGEQVEALLDQVASGNAGGGGGGGIAVETDPIFSASPAASITEDDKEAWNNKVSYSVKDFSMVNADGFMTSEGDGFVFPNTPAAQAEQGFVLATLDDIPNGVQSVAQTTTSNADGGSNIVTVTLTDGTKSTFTVKNGSKGSQGIQGIQGEQGPKGDTGATGADGAKGDKGDKGDTGATGANGTNGKDGADGEDGATFTPSVDSAGNLSWSNNKGLANPPTVNIKGPKGDAGEGGGSSGGEGVIQWTTRYAPDYTNEDGVINLDPFVVYYGGFFPSGGTIYLNSNADYNEWRIIFYIYPNCSLNFEVAEWVNGITPDISKGGHYELSVVENEAAHLGIMAHFS